VKILMSMVLLSGSSAAIPRLLTRPGVR
jgi:hypothetical protein